MEILRNHARALAAQAREVRAGRADGPSGPIVVIVAAMKWVVPTIVLVLGVVWIAQSCVIWRDLVANGI